MTRCIIGASARSEFVPSGGKVTFLSGAINLSRLLGDIPADRYTTASAQQGLLAAVFQKCGEHPAHFVTPRGVVDRVLGSA